VTGATQTSGDVIFRHAEAVMGTVVSFDVRPRGLAYEATRAALGRACEVLHQADEVFSLYRPDSPLSRLRRGELTLAQCPPEVSDVLALCKQARELSCGWFDPWALPGGVDPTGLVKGWAARQAAQALQEAGVGAGMVNAAGDIVVFGQPAPARSWRMGVRSAEDPDRLLCIVEGTRAVATSGNYERGEHVRDVRTGGPAATALSATVCGPDLAFADAFATGLLAAGEAGFGAVTRAGYEALIMLPGGGGVSTPAFPIFKGAFK
jgi:thiamine biosynthesis lipoprotein